MMKKISFNVYFFILLGGLEGMLIGLPVAFLFDYLSIAYGAIYSLTAIDLYLVVGPLLFCFGILFNALGAYFMKEEKKERKGIFKLFKISK